MLLIFDGNNLIYRSYFGVKQLTTSNGVATNALYGSLKSFRSIIHDFNPKNIIIAWDSGKKTFRHEHDETYKANREPIQNDLKLQFPIVQEAFDYLGVPQMTADGVECDDLIGTIVTRCSTKGIKSVIVSSDKDFYQLIDENIQVFSPTVKKKDDCGLVDCEFVRKHFGVNPDQLVDIKAMTGERTDNIKGVAGIGPKTATSLIQRHGTVFNVIKALKANTIIQERHKPILQNIDVIANAYHLAKIRTNVVIPETPVVPVQNIIIKRDALLAFFKHYQMKQFLDERDTWFNLFNYKYSITFR